MTVFLNFSLKSKYLTPNDTKVNIIIALRCSTVLKSIKDRFALIFTTNDDQSISVLSSLSKKKVFIHIVSFIINPNDIYRTIKLNSFYDNIRYFPIFSGFVQNTEPKMTIIPSIYVDILCNQ